MEILIVEDEPLMGLELQCALRESGHQVVGLAPTVPSALRLAAATSPRIALVDIFLGPRPDGLKVAAELASQGVLVIFLTASAEVVPDDLPNAIGLIRKPYRLEGILEALEFVMAAATSGARPQSVPSCMRLARAIRPDVDGRYTLAGPPHTLQ